MPRRAPLSPRNRGLAILVGCSGCALINLFAMRSWNEYYPFLFPFAFALAPVGVILLLTGATQEELRAGKFQNAARAMLLLMAIGVFVGLVVNHRVGR